MKVRGRNVLIWLATWSAIGLIFAGQTYLDSFYRAAVWQFPKLWFWRWPGGTGGRSSRRSSPGWRGALHCFGPARALGRS